MKAWMVWVITAIAALLTDTLLYFVWTSSVSSLPTIPPPPNSTTTSGCDGTDTSYTHHAATLMMHMVVGVSSGGGGGGHERCVTNNSSSSTSFSALDALLTLISMCCVECLFSPFILCGRDAHMLYLSCHSSCESFISMYNSRSLCRLILLVCLCF